MAWERFFAEYGGSKSSTKKSSLDGLITLLNSETSETTEGIALIKAEIVRVRRSKRVFNPNPSRKYDTALGILEEEVAEAEQKLRPTYEAPRARALSLAELPIPGFEVRWSQVAPALSLPVDDALCGATLYNIVKTRLPEVYERIKGVTRAGIATAKEEARETNPTLTPPYFLSVVGMFDAVHALDELHDDALLPALFALDDGDVMLDLCARVAPEGLTMLKHQWQSAEHRQVGLQKHMLDCAKAAADAYEANLEGALERSFAGTYVNADVADLLVQTKVTLDKELVVKRIFETAAVMDRLLRYGHFIADTVALTEMHLQRFKVYKRRDAGHEDRPNGAPFYNVGSVLYTLLTFSVLMIGEAGDPLPESMTNKQRKGWYGFWRLFGSGMGIPSELLPVDYESSLGLWTALNDPGNGQITNGRNFRMLQSVYAKKLSTPAKELGGGGISAVFSMRQKKSRTFAAEGQGYMAQRAAFLEEEERRGSGSATLETLVDQSQRERISLAQLMRTAKTSGNDVEFQRLKGLLEALG